METEFKELEEIAVKEAKEAFESNWFVDNSDDEETGEFYTDVENEFSDRIFKKISEMENVKNISGTLNQKFYSFYVNSETGKDLTIEDFADVFGLE